MYNYVRTTILLPISFMKRGVILCFLAIFGRHQIMWSTHGVSLLTVSSWEF